MGEEKRKKMMILGASALQVPAIKKAKELGYRIILVDYDENAVGFALADVKLVVSTLDLHQRRPCPNSGLCQRKAGEAAGSVL